MINISNTIKESFKILKQNLEITDYQESTVSTRQKNVRKVIENKFTVLDSFLTGSYSRHTMIAPLKEADIDIFIILDPKYYHKDGQVSLLDNIRKALLETYPKTPKISRNGQAVTITFSDFVVDVVPAFNRKNDGFMIPDSINNVWINTNPKIHVDYSQKENKKHNGELIPIIKMIKGWNKNINFSFVSFYLELMTIRIFKDKTISDYSNSLKYFFNEGRELIKYKMKDPVDYGGYINGLSNISTVEEGIKKFEDAYKTTLQANIYEIKGENEKAINEWKKIFGDYFPSYE